MAASAAERNDRSRTGPLGREAIVALLLDLFRRDGFDGVSMADVARATGLGKSSLYHHFPGGKEEMAAAVMQAVAATIEREVVARLRAQAPRAARIDGMLASLRDLYDGGARPCVIASMLVGAEGGPAFGAIRAVFIAWRDALRAALEETGADAGAAGAAADDALSRIQGALLMCRALGERAPFENALASARRDLMAA